MATSFIWILLIIIFVLLLIKRIRASLIILVFTILCFMGIGSGLISESLLKPLQSSFLDLPSPQWRNKNAIVLLGAGAINTPRNIIKPSILAYSRITEAARLYLACIKNHNKCTIIVSGGDALTIGKSEAMVYRDVLLDLGINNADIELESNSMNTFKNAEFTSAILKKNNYDQVILVTSGIHLKRSLLYFSHFKIQAIPGLADYLAPQISLIPLGYNFTLTDFVIHEYLGIMRFHVYNFFGWNKAVSSPGMP